MVSVRLSRKDNNIIIVELVPIRLGPLPNVLLSVSCKIRGFRFIIHRQSTRIDAEDGILYQGRNGSLPLGKCNTAVNQYCCFGDSECNCDSGKNAVKLKASPTTVTVIGLATWTVSSSTLSTSSSSSSSSNPTRSSSVSSSTMTPTPSQSMTESSRSQSPIASPSPSSTSDSSRTTKIAVAVAVPIGASLVLAIACLGWRNHRLRKRVSTYTPERLPQREGLELDSNPYYEAPSRSLEATTGRSVQTISLAELGSENIPSVGKRGI